MSKNINITCDICGEVVAKKDTHCLFSCLTTITPYLSVPYNYIGVDCTDGLGCNEKKDYHICKDCIWAIKKHLGERKNEI